MTPSQPYNDAFFDFHEQRSRASARETIPLVLRYVQPASIVDVGCGNGTWLSEFNSAGIFDVLGIDGEWVNPAKLLIERDNFREADLTQPLAVDRMYDLAMSLEVAEHLRPECAATFVQSLVGLAPVVLFSAAIPYQGGTGHVNEQFPEYWAALFQQHDYVAVDCLRRALWNNTNVAWYYRQNLLFFVDRKRLSNYPRLADAFAHAGENPGLSLVHPEQYSAMYDRFREARCLAMRYAARLRRINLVAFPDWSQSADQVESQIRTLLASVRDHPQRRDITLVVILGRSNEESAGSLLYRLVDATVESNNLRPDDRPGVSAVGGSFSEWETLIECLQFRVGLDREDSQTIASTHADKLPVVDLTSVRSCQFLESGAEIHARSAELEGG